MKKIIIGAFALAFAFFGSAQAQDVKVGGLFQQIIGFGDDTTGGISHQFDRLVLSASTTTDNGWEVGGNWNQRSEYDSGASAGPAELKMYVTNQFGTFNIGNTTDAVTNTMQRVAAMVPGGGNDSGYNYLFYGSTEGDRGVRFAEAYYAYNGHRVVWAPPAFQSVQFRGSYTPSHDNSDITAAGRGTNGNTAASNHQETVEAAVSWSGDLEGFAVSAALGSKNGNGLASWKDGNDLNDITGSIKVSQGAWTVGYHVYDNGDSYGQSTDSSKASSSGWNTAATYDMGNITLGVGYSYMEAVNGTTYNTTLGADGASHVRATDIFQVGLGYALGGGVTTYIQYSDYDIDDGEAATTEVSPQVVVMGISMGF